MDNELFCISKKLIEELDVRNVKYCHWKSNEHLYEGLVGLTDLDILVDREDKREFESVLNSLRFIRVYGKINYVSGIDNWIGYDPSDSSYIHLHVHYDIVTGHKGVKEYHLPWASLVLNNTENSNYGIPVVNPNLEYALLIVRICLKLNVKSFVKCLFLHKSTVSKSIRKEIDYLRNRTYPDQISSFIKEMGLSDTVNESIIDFIDEDIYPAIKVHRLKKKLVKELKDYCSLSVYNASINAFVSRFCDVIKAMYDKLIGGKSSYTFRKKISSGGGCMIALIGADGSGKSTNINKLYNWLNWKLETKIVYAGSGDGSNSWIQKVSSSLFRGSHGGSGRIKISNGTINSNNKNKSVIKGIAKAWVLYKSSSSKLKIIKTAARLRNKGFIVLVDRFPQNQFLGIGDSPRIGVLLSDIMGNTIINRFRIMEERNFLRMQKFTPDFAIKLLVSPEVAKQRKPDHDIEYIRIKSEVVNKLAFPGSHLYTIDANQQADEVFSRIKEIVWENIQ